MSRWGRDRAQTEVLGYVVIAGIAIALATVIFVVAIAALSQGQLTLGSDQGTEIIVIAAGQAGLITDGVATAQTVDVGSGTRGQFFVREEVGHIRIDHNFSGSGRADEVLLNADLGTLSYEDGERRVALQGGGVWRAGREGTVRVEQPPLEHRNRTLNAPITRLRGTDAATGSPTIVLQDGGTTPIYPNGSNTYSDSAPFRHPIDNGTVRVAVSGPYYEGWGAYFRDRFNGTVSVHDGNQTAVVSMEGGSQVEFLHLSDTVVEARFD
jgi:hypothetical protein